MEWNMEKNEFDMKYDSRTALWSGADKKWNFTFEVTIPFTIMNDLLAYDYELGTKIPGIKLIREKYGVGLRDAKDIYEEYEYLRRKQEKIEVKSQEYISAANEMLKEFS